MSSDKKRKAPSQEHDRPSKKQQTATSVKVNHVPGPDTAKPVVATSAASKLSPKLKFDAYSQRNSSSSRNLLLQSSDHPTIDYTAVETRTINSTEHHLKHYIAVFGPATGSLDVTEAKKMVVRPHVRKFQTEQEDDNEKHSAPIPKPSSRAALTEAFGTKKSKRAVQSIAENRLLGRGGDGEDELSQAILNTPVGEDDDGAGIPDINRINKPLPRANLIAENIEDAYPLSTLVTPSPHQDTLSNLSIAYWKDRIANSKPVLTSSRFVANRVSYIVQAHLASSDNSSRIQHVQVLRYVEVLLHLHKYVRTLPRSGYFAPPEKWPAKEQTFFANASEQGDHLSKLLSRFFPDRKPSDHAVTLLRSTILALGLHVPPPSLEAGHKMLVCEPTDLSLDLALEQKDIAMLFRELGCKIEPGTDAELARWGLGKMGKTVGADGKEFTPPKPKFAKLRLPLQFPKLSQGKNISAGKRR